MFHTEGAAGNLGARLVRWITTAMVVVEIAAGWFYNWMALLADGFHISSHTVAIGLSAIAYAAARRYAKDPRFSFGNWKIEVLGSFASAIVWRTLHSGSQRPQYSVQGLYKSSEGR